MSLRFSVITCTWNSAAWLDNCLASLEAQDYPELELVFVDGGSHDGTLEKLRAVRRPYRLIENVDGGISAAMNRGLSAASGEVLACLHADDYYLHPAVLTRVAHALENGSRDWLFGRIVRDLGGRLLAEGFAAPAFSRSRLMRRNFIPHPAVFARRWLFEHCGPFDTRLRHAMDYDMWLRFSRVAEPLQLGCALAAFRVHQGSLSAREPRAALEEDFEVRLRHAGPSPLRRAEFMARHLLRRRHLLADTEPA